MKLSEKIRAKVFFTIVVPISVADPESHYFIKMKSCIQIRTKKGLKLVLQIRSGYHSDEDPHEIRGRNSFKVTVESATGSTSKCKKGTGPGSALKRKAGSGFFSRPVDEEERNE